MITRLIGFMSAGEGVGDDGFCVVCLGGGSGCEFGLGVNAQWYWGFLLAVLRCFSIVTSRSCVESLLLVMFAIYSYTL